jgi:hypothetical protein
VCYIDAIVKESPGVEGLGLASPSCCPHRAPEIMKKNEQEIEFDLLKR